MSMLRFMFRSDQAEGLRVTMVLYIECGFHLLYVAHEIVPHSFFRLTDCDVLFLLLFCS